MPGPAERTRIVLVAPCLGVRSLPRPIFDYLPPREMPPEAALVVGSVVSVPFGARVVRGCVLGFSSSTGVPDNELRRISSVSADTAPEELLGLAREMSDYYLAPLGACLRLFLPPPKRTGAVQKAPLWLLPLPAPVGDVTAPRVSRKQACLLAATGEKGAPLSEALRSAGVSRGVADALVKKGCATIEPRPAAAPAGRAGVSMTTVTAPSLTDEQVAARDGLLAALAADTPERALLFGATGSGKTEVYISVIEEVLKTGGGALVVVPEIALTRALVARFEERLGGRIALWHSGLSPARRRREYERIVSGEARVVVGARSAVCAPLSGPRLIVLDESHDGSFKHEEEPRYNARWVAWQRIVRSRGLLIEGTATPRCESLVENQRIFRMRRRPLGATVPSIEVVDMRRQGDGRLLAPVTRKALLEVMSDHKQAVILLNRRGYAGYVFCESCGHVLTCPRCDVSLTLHRERGRLVCHRCGLIEEPPGLCPMCRSASLSRSVPGAEHLERELATLVPAEHLFRLDSDVAGTAARAKDILSRFESTLPGVLVGTQMVAKGHDLSMVTLTVVANADLGLFVPDFRSAERTYQLITQAVGRGGRGAHRARALVQTWNPDIPCIRMATQGDAARFYRSELAERKKLGFPPYRRLVRVVFVSREEERARMGASHFVERLRRQGVDGSNIWGPARLLRLRGRHRWHIVVAGDGAGHMPVVGGLSAKLRPPYEKRGVDIVTDVDPEWFQ